MDQRVAGSDTNCGKLLRSSKSILKLAGSLARRHRQWNSYGDCWTVPAHTASPGREWASMASIIRYASAVAWFLPMIGN